MRFSLEKVSIMFSIVLFIIASFIFALSYRNIDTGLNMCIIEKEAGIQVLDFDFFNRAYDFRGVYAVSYTHLTLPTKRIV